MKRKVFGIAILLLIFLVPSVCLFAETAGTIQFSYSLNRYQQGMMSDIYFALPSGQRIENGAYCVIDDMDRAYDEPLFYVVVTNNLTNKVDSERRLYIRFTPMTTAGSNFKGGYIATMWRLTDPENINSTLIKPRDKICVVSNEAGTSSNEGTFNWGLNYAYANAAAYAAGGGANKTFYYAISVFFNGMVIKNQKGNDEMVNYSDAYSPGKTYTATVFLEVAGN